MTRWSKTGNPGQSGFASIYAVLAIITLLLVVAAAFAFVASQEYTQGASEEAKTRARHAAETALNDARQLIYAQVNEKLASNKPDQWGILQKPFGVSSVGADSNTDDILYDCGGGNTYSEDSLKRLPIANPDNLGQLDTEGSINYTCVRLDDQPTDLVYQKLTKERNEHILVQTRSAAGNKSSNAGRININWKASHNTGASYSNPSYNSTPPPTGLVAEAKYNYKSPLLQISLIPMNLRDGWNRVNLEQYQRSYLLHPSLHGNSGSIDDKAKIKVYNHKLKKGTDLQLIYSYDNDQGLGNISLFSETKEIKEAKYDSVGHSVTCPASLTKTGSYIAEAKKEKYCFKVEFSDGLYETIDYSVASSPTTDENRNNQIIYGDCDDTIETYDCQAQIIIGPLSDGYVNNENTDLESCHSILDRDFGENAPIPNPDAITPDKCNSSYTLTPTPGNHPEIAYILLIKPLYMDADVQIKAYDKNDTQLKLINQQVKVTANAQSSSINYRLQEVLPIQPKYTRPDWAINSAESVCKIITGNPDTGVSIGDKIEKVYQAATSPAGYNACRFENDDSP